MDRTYPWTVRDRIIGTQWTICLPKSEGGLGIRIIADVNKALMLNHVWSILNNRESLWVKWIHSYRLKARSLWDVPIRQNCLWGWRKMLQLRHLIRPHIWSRIGNGLNTSVWFDKWHQISPICSHVPNRDIVRAGFSLHASVSEFIREGDWKWPSAWLDLFPVLINIPNVHLISNVQDIGKKLMVLSTLSPRQWYGKQLELSRLLLHGIKHLTNDTKTHVPNLAHGS
uniref:uncharacterized protein LOC122584974 n=1 Tax=Erigeron canadensis TaxID=72917 RepID=UPI001CB9A53C|nr:uncharacterized protein LOC122584974 [Erigeron canadensis]